MVRPDLEAVALPGQLTGRQAASLPIAQYGAGTVLGPLHIRLVEGVDVEKMASDSRGHLPAEELRSEARRSLTNLNDNHRRFVFDEGPDLSVERPVGPQIDEQPIRTMTLSEEDQVLFSGYRFLTQKPLLLVLNVDEAKVAAPQPADIAEHAQRRGLGLVVLSAKVEQDIAQMSGEDQKEFVSALGLAEPARDRFIRAAFALLDLISFLTSGPDECRAWPIRRGTVAQRAAGKVHSDIERGFIRAEVIRVEDLLALGSEAKCREAGKLRLEGKEYVVQDGDVINFRFNV